jgi:glutamyl-tRNA reductase
MLHIVVLGINYKTAPVEVRERFSFSKSMLESGLLALKSKKSVEECCILSTCNRMEIYAVSKDIDDCVKDMKEFLCEFHQVPLEAFSSYLHVLADRKAINHLFRVASSLDSMVVGEPQILGQVKEAYRVASSSGTTGLILNRLFHTAFFVAKKVRTRTGIGTQAVSISYAAVELSKRIFGALSNRTVMLVGTGDMAELAARHLVKAGIRDLIIASRTLDKAESLSRKLNGKAIKIEEIYYHLKGVDIVITATGSPDFIIRPGHVSEALKLRRNEPIFMIDIAVPRDIDPRIGEMENVYLYDIDDLKGVIEENLKIRREHAQMAEEIILRGEKYFQAWLEGLKVVPTIISLRRRLEEIKTFELERAFRKLGNLSEREKKVIESMASGIVGKILYSPVTNLKKEASSSLGALYVDAVKRLFGLEHNFGTEEKNETGSKDRK